MTENWLSKRIVRHLKDVENTILYMEREPGKEDNFYYRFVRRTLTEINTMMGTLLQVAIGLDLFPIPRININIPRKSDKQLGIIIDGQRTDINQFFGVFQEFESAIKVVGTYLNNTYMMEQIKNGTLFVSEINKMKSLNFTIEEIMEIIKNCLKEE